MESTSEESESADNKGNEGAVASNAKHGEYFKANNGPTKKKIR